MVFTPKGLYLLAQGRERSERTLGDRGRTSIELLPVGAVKRGCTALSAYPGCARCARDPGLCCVTPSG